MVASRTFDSTHPPPPPVFEFCRVSLTSERACCIRQQDANTMLKDINALAAYVSQKTREDTEARAQLVKSIETAHEEVKTGSGNGDDFESQEYRSEIRRQRG